MSVQSRKRLLFLVLLFGMVVVMSAFVNAAVFADAVTVSLVPARDVEFGEKVGNVIVSSDGKTVYQNFQRGYCVAELISNSQVQNKRDVGGQNVDKSGNATFIDSTIMESWILGRGEDSEVGKYWKKIANKYAIARDYNLSTLLTKIVAKYNALCKDGYNCGLPTDNVSVWDESVIKLDFYDGDSAYGFGGNRVRVTTLAYSFLEDDIYMIGGEFFNYYQNAKAGSLCEPISDPFNYKLDNVDGKVQSFAQGLIFLSNSGKLSVKAGVRFDKQTQKFEPLVLDYGDITHTDIVQVAIDSNPYYGTGNKNKFTVDSVKDAFYAKYLELIDAKFNPGLPDSEGIFYWDSEVIKQAYVGSDDCGNAWNRTNMMLVLNPIDAKVYKISGAILNIVDESSQGLGNAQRLGYPLADEKTQILNGLTYVYQDFSKGTIYSISGEEQLTRFIKGKTFAQVTEERANFKPNNPMFFYVIEPWVFVLVGGLLVVVSVVLVVLKAKGAFVKKSVVTKEEDKQ